MLPHMALYFDHICRSISQEKYTTWDICQDNTLDQDICRGNIQAETLPGQVSRSQVLSRQISAVQDIAQANVPGSGKCSSKCPNDGQSMAGINSVINTDSSSLPRQDRGN